MFFNQEIDPKDLRKILHKNIGRLRKQYRHRKQEMIINDAQWNLIENKNGIIYKVYILCYLFLLFRFFNLLVSVFPSVSCLRPGFLFA